MVRVNARMVVDRMFCPECGCLSYPDDRGWIKCPDYKCGYEGPLSGEDGRGSEFTDPMTGEVIDLANTTATTDSKSSEASYRSCRRRWPQRDSQSGRLSMPQM